MQEKPLAFLSLIEVLERVVGRKTGYALLEPFPCTTLRNGEPAIPSIENAGKIIAAHVGLASLSFVIRVVDLQDPHIAGHIELQDESPNVTVEIARDTCKFEEAVLETLCHEISHKFLHVHGIRHGIDQIEQEYLTDVTAVYLGLGKLMLNGCECKGYHKTVRLGYISRECFAFVYRLVCEMRQIPAERYLAGLSEAALETMALISQTHARWFRHEYHEAGGVAELVDGLRPQIRETQLRAAKLDQTRRRVKHESEALQNHLRNSHKSLFAAETQINRLLEPIDNPHLRYLNCMRARESVTDLTRDASRTLAQARLAWECLDALVKVASPDQSNDETEVVECPRDATKLRVPSGRKSLLVNCSYCNYKFIVTTVNQPSRTEKQAKPARMSRLLATLKGAFGFG